MRVEDARFQQLLFGYQNTVLKASQEVEDALVGLPQGAGSRRCPADAVTAARRSVELAFLQYREGAVDFLRVLDAERTQLQEENSLAQTLSDRDQLDQLYKALGGGWETSAKANRSSAKHAGRDGATYQLGRLLRSRRRSPKPPRRQPRD